MTGRVTGSSDAAEGTITDTNDVTLFLDDEFNVLSPPKRRPG